MGWVYAIECVPTGELYIGSTTMTPRFRFYNHKTDLKHGRGSPLLQAAYNAHGWESLRLVPMKEFPDDQVRERETEAIAKVKPALNMKELNDPSVYEQGRAAGVSKALLHSRALRGLTGAELISPPYANKKRYEVRGEMLTAPEIAAKYGLKETTVRARASGGQLGEEIIRKGRRCRRTRLVIDL